MKAVLEALDAFRADMQAIGGCTDGGCRIVKPVGVHTNGGCRCFRDPTRMQRYMNATERLIKALEASPSTAADRGANKDWSCSQCGQPWRVPHSCPNRNETTK